MTDSFKPLTPAELIKLAEHIELGHAESPVYNFYRRAVMNDQIVDLNRACAAVRDERNAKRRARAAQSRSAE